jgi:hypothetical protein
MNRALLAELQRLNAYPSVTILTNTHPSDPMRDDDSRRIDALIADADRRLAGDVTDDVRARVVAALRELAFEASLRPATRAVALCASPEHRALVHLGREVRTRVVVDDTFATRDMVADANRTAAFRVITMSDRKARLLVGDRHRLAEQRDDRWPIVRDDLDSDTLWRRAIADALAAESDEVPTIVAGVTRTTREFEALLPRPPIGRIAGAHDRTGWPELHRIAWPLVVDWLRADGQRAIDELEAARGARLFAGGIDEVWQLAHDGRVRLLVVEDDFELSARLEPRGIVPTSDRDQPGVVDDVVDELIESVLVRGGDAVIVPSQQLADHGRVAAALRY